MFILDEQSTGEAEKPVALPSDRVYHEHRGVEGYDGTFPDREDPAVSQAGFPGDREYYDHSRQDPGKHIIMLKKGYFRNPSIPRGGDYGSRLDLIPGSRLYLLTIVNSDGLIVSQSYPAWDDVAKRENLLLRKAKRSIFIGVPHRGMALQSIWG